MSFERSEGSTVHTRTAMVRFPRMKAPLLFSAYGKRFNAASMIPIALRVTTTVKNLLSKASQRRKIDGDFYSPISVEE